RVVRHRHLLKWGRPPGENEMIRYVIVRPSGGGMMVRQITAKDLAKKLANDHPVYLLDVRQPWEHETAALPGSVLVPLTELGRRAEGVRPAEGALLVVYCHHGVRSMSAAAFLEEQGHREVASLAGGIDAWSCEVDPTVPRY